MGVKIGKKLGFHVTVLSTSLRKKEAALQIGADDFIVSTDPAQTQAMESFHLILDTISSDHDISRLLSKFLKVDAILCLVGIPPNEISLPAMDVISGRHTFTGSGIGGMQETQDMMNFCATHQVFPTVELIDAKDVNHKIHALATNSFDARRFVIRVKETLATVTDEKWEVEDEPAINPAAFHIHSKAKIHPPSASTKKQQQHRKMLEDSVE